MDDEVKAAAQLLGAIGGKRNTTRQNQARAQNGKRGGRPKKIIENSSCKNQSGLVNVKAQ